MPPRRKPTFTRIKLTWKSKQFRIRVPQPTDRPLRLHRRDLLRTELLRPDRWYFVTHRRGPQRTLVGEDPLEARATQGITGTLPERIVQKYLTTVLRFVEGSDFSMQSSLEGGRVELGGLVADFLFPRLGLVLNPAGPTHEAFLRIRKDEEQNQIFAEYGYLQYIFDDDICYREDKLEEFMRMVFRLGPVGGGGGAFGPHDHPQQSLPVTDLNQLSNLIHSLFLNVTALEGLNG
jgi:hypothetical protein